MKFVFAKFDVSLVHIGIIVGVGSSFPLISRFVKGVFVKGPPPPPPPQTRHACVCWPRVSAGRVSSNPGSYTVDHSLSWGADHSELVPGRCGCRRPGQSRKVSDAVYDPWKINPLI